MGGINRSAPASHAFTFETRGLGGESVGQKGASYPDCAVWTINNNYNPGNQRDFSAHQSGNMENVLAVLNLGDFAQMFSKMGMFPVFDLAYYIVSILYLKYEPGE